VAFLLTLLPAIARCNKSRSNPFDPRRQEQSRTLLAAMSFANSVAAEDLAEFLRSNDGNRQELELKEDSYGGFGAWTASQFDRVADAAKRNTSVRAFSMDVANLDSSCVGTV
jgi:hypothetical protein